MSQKYYLEKIRSTFTEMNFYVTYSYHKTE